MLCYLHARNRIVTCLAVTNAPILIPEFPKMGNKALMAFLHVVDPTTETPGDKLQKVDSFIEYFKGRCLSLYQPRQNVAIDERMVKSRHRSGIRQYIIIIWL